MKWNSGLGHVELYGVDSQKLFFIYAYRPFQIPIAHYYTASKNILLRNFRLQAEIAYCLNY